MSRKPTKNAKTARPGIGRPFLVVLIALVMGLPFVRGGFVGGDDHRLLLNHVLVNHPSLSHAIQLFGIVHRDLYQPVPLLSFSAEFAVASALGLFDHGVDGGAWLFHATNIVLHAANTLFVFIVIAMLHKGCTSGGKPERAADLVTFDSGNSAAALFIATVAALVFAVHPLQVEVVAWLNGRMMLLSTFFALAAMLTFARWLRQGRWLWAAATLVLVTLCMMSKVRVGVPALLGIVALALRHRMRLRFGLTWAACTAITGVFVVINLKTTADSDFFSLAGEHMTGPRAVRVLRSLGWYAQHFVWPTGLASWYPAPPSVAWSDSETVRALVVVLLSLAICAGIFRKSLPIALGAAWFLSTIVDTLPIVPARNVLAADRYMYLPIIGLVWILGTVAYRIVIRLRTSPAGRARMAAFGFVGVVALAAMLGTSWYTGSFYAKAIPKTERIAQLFPNTPNVWARLGWAYHKQGNTAQLENRTADAAAHYAKAIECAQRELAQPNPRGWSEACQVIGATKLKLGDADEALRVMHRAVELDPKNVEPRYWLAWAYDELGRTSQAIEQYELALAGAPGHNPTLLRLGQLYRLVGRPSDARQMYERALANNAYESPAILGLAELDVEQRTQESCASADRRLTELLAWMPENTSALVLLAVSRQCLGRTSEAIQIYERILQKAPNNATAALNLGQIHFAAKDVERALPLFYRAAQSTPQTNEEAASISDFFLETNDVERIMRLWEQLLSQRPDSASTQEMAGWYLAIAGHAPRAKSILTGQKDQSAPLASATRAYLALSEERFDDLQSEVATLCSNGPSGSVARQRLLQSLERFDAQRPNVPWTFAIAAQLLQAEGKTEEAKVFLQLAEERCKDERCTNYLRIIRPR